MNAQGVGPRYGYAGAMPGLKGLAMGSRRKMVVSSARSRQGRDLFCGFHSDSGLTPRKRREFQAASSTSRIVQGTEEQR